MAVYPGFENGNGAAAPQGADEKRDAFVGGLSPDTTESDLNTYFTQFGPVLHSVVKRDLNTGLSRGFGFVTFADTTGLSKISSVQMHILKGKKIDAKPAVRKSKDAVTKIFVGGVDTNMSEEDVKAYFERFGKVITVQWPKDRLRDGAKKNFVFVEFEDANVVEQLVKTPKHSVGSRLCDVRKAVPAAAKPPTAYAADPYGGAYGYAPYAYDPAAFGAYYDPNAAAAYNSAAYTGYAVDPSASTYPGYGVDPAAAQAAPAAYDPSYAVASTAAAPAAPAQTYDHYAAVTAAGAYGIVGYPGADATAYPARPAYRPRAAVPLAVRGGAVRPPPFAGAARPGLRPFHPYRRV